MANFKEIKVKNIEGEVEVIDFSKQIGNFLYTQGKDVAVCEAGQKIYHGEETDLTDEAKELVRSFAENVPFIFKQAITAEIGRHHEAHLFSFTTLKGGAAILKPLPLSSFP